MNPESSTPARENLARIRTRIRTGARFAVVGARLHCRHVGQASNPVTIQTRRVPLNAPDGHGAIVYDGGRLDRAGPELFDPMAWSEPARPVISGGRGAAWFVRGGFGSAVLRHCRRGGLLARCLGDRYLFLGEARVRSLREFRLLAKLREHGLPVPAPLAAGYRRRGPFYRADLLVERIPGVRSLAELLAESLDAPDWEAIGRLIARFHRVGVHHADLNAHNILMDVERRHYLIDFDRGRLRPPRAGWRRANLARLWRSLSKLRGTFLEAELARRFERLRQAYRADFGTDA